jgi:hypothetical protein
MVLSTPKAIVSSDDAATLSFSSAYMLAYDTFAHHKPGRRFLRLHKWIDNFNVASTAMYSSKPRIPKLLETGKFNFLGLYFLMELLTITDVMGFTKLEWGPWLVVESHRFWSYGLLCSILLAVWEWYFVGEDEEKRRLVVEKEKKKGTKGSLDKKVANSGPKKRRLPYKQIVIDGCDLFIPGAVVGWLPLSALTVAVAMAISTVLQLTDMWPKIQAQAAGASPQKK